jgi:glutamate synthase (NADPH/NADH) small chain
MATTPLTPEQLAANFSDLHPNYSRDEAVIEASRCLFCYDAPCTRACPTHIDVPRFIRQILHDDVASAAETILDANILGGSCARACPTEVLCEGACVDRARSGAPIEIGRLQRYATDYALDRGLRFFEPGPETGRRVAVVGSGPAGLSAAHELRRLGHAVTIFEARDVPGGLNTLGIAAYKLPAEFSLREIEPILEMGIDLRLNSPIDGSALARLREEFDAVFVGVGLGSTQSLGLPGESAAGVWEALEFIYQLHTGPLEACQVGRQVVVIGCGNTAIDVATQAVRLGAESVVITYRRGEAQKSAYNYEYDLGKADGVRFEWFAQPVEFVESGGAVTGVRFIRTRQVAGEGRTGRLEEIPGSEFVIPCDMAVKALGQSPIVDLLAVVNPAAVRNGRAVIDPQTYATPIDGVFAGGDCTSKGKEIVNAVEDGKQAARSIDRHLASQPAKRSH